MILILKKLNKLIFSFLLVLLLWPSLAVAQNSLTISVTPTLFQMSAMPGQIWESQIKVVNSNNFTLTVYAEPVNLLPSGEQGHSKFVPIFENITEGSTLAEWIRYDKSVPIVIPPLQSATIPFIIEVPEDASPGGHFAAMLVGTRPPTEEDKLLVRTSQLVSSLFFLRLEGDVEENGRIRSFAVENKIVQTPEAKLSVTFENRGNVHLQPQGQIKIFNMWGKERGVIPINTKTHFGNVLPQSKRKFEFSWSGESSLTDIGRYKAEVGLAYGLEEKKFETSELYFWVIPVKPLIIGLVSLSSFFYLLVLMIRAYVRRMLILAGLDPDQANTPTEVQSRKSKIIYAGDVKLTNYQSIAAPMRSGMADLRLRLSQVSLGFGFLKVLSSFAYAYKWFFLSLLVIILGAITVSWYFKEVMVEQRNYDIRIENPNAPILLNAEEVILQGLNDTNLNTPASASSTEQNFHINIVNTSNEPGLSAKAARQLQSYNFVINSVSANPDRRDRKSVLVYPIGFESEALAISKILNGALLSASASAGDDNVIPTITIYAGEDLIQTSQN